MAVKIYGVSGATGTQHVLVVAKELGVPYTIVPVDMKAGAHKTAEYIATMHPFGQTPVLEDEDGFKVYEARAIGRYLAAKAGDERLLPRTDVKKLAHFEQAASVEQHDFHPLALGIALERYYKPLRGQATDEKRVAELEAALVEKLKVYEVILGKTKYLAGDVSVFLPYLRYPFAQRLVTDQFLKATPNVARWWADISSRASWKANGRVRVPRQRRVF
ncbi:glutathione S-transferase [Phellopilus nigrolimitatus]|nr:glutathione S-transferase [Phellopilus nigrolimitatus]